MHKVDRRSFIKAMGQSAVVLSAGFSQRDAFGQQGQGKATGAKKKKRIAVEEHIGFEEYNSYVSSLNAAKAVPGMPGGSPGGGMPGGGMPGGGGPTSTLPDGTKVSTDVLGDVTGIDTRLKVMDQTGIDMQVLSLRNPGVEEFETSEAINWARKINNKLAEVVGKYPERFSAFCTIPWQEPTAAIAELERAVKELGLRGIKMDGTVKGEYLDSKRFWPIFKKAEELGTPIFIHVEDTRDSMIKFYSEFSESSATTGVGRDFDVCYHAARLIYSGLFDECPKLNFILGHMGAGIHFYPGRMTGGRGMKKTAADYIKQNFFAVTSGNFYLPSLMCCYYATGADRILFGVDFPTESNEEAVKLVESAPISDGDKEKIFHLNAEELFRV
ncbi:MAG: amidohydrolase [Deltaproteobacteria bacterium]|nr:amidohydrolase [Deltaproteobacteria bacterium]